MSTSKVFIPTKSKVVGSNVHSDEQGRALCSSSVKVCNMFRVEGFAFCWKHILEDPSAPFKQCEYTLKDGNQCKNNINIHSDDPRYCSRHKQALGLIPKPIRPSSSSLPPTPQKPIIYPSPSLIPDETTHSSKPRPDDSKTSFDEFDDLSDSLSDSSSIPDDQFMETLYPPLSLPLHFYDFFATDHFSSETPDLELGNPKFDFPCFVETRAHKLSNLVKIHRMQLQQIDMAFQKCRPILHKMRVKMRTILENEKHLDAIAQSRKISKYAKLAKMKREEDQKRKGMMETRQELNINSTTSSSMQKDSSVSTGSQTPSSSKKRSKATTSSGNSASLEEVQAGETEIKRKTVLEFPVPCTFPSCMATSLPLSKFCWCHILHDPQQVLFTGCPFPSKDGKSKCNFPIIKLQQPHFCFNHIDIISKQER